MRRCSPFSSLRKDWVWLAFGEPRSRRRSCLCRCHGSSRSGGYPASRGSTRRRHRMQPPCGVHHRTAHRSPDDECRGHNMPAPFSVAAVFCSPGSPNTRPTYVLPGGPASCATCTAERHPCLSADPLTPTSGCWVDCCDRRGPFRDPIVGRRGVASTTRANGDDRGRRDRRRHVGGLGRVRRRSVIDRRDARARVARDGCDDRRRRRESCRGCLLPPGGGGASLSARPPVARATRRPFSARRELEKRL